MFGLFEEKLPESFGRGSSIDDLQAWSCMGEPKHPDNEDVCQAEAHVVDGCRV